MRDIGDYELPEPEEFRDRIPPTERIAVATGGMRPRTALVVSPDRREAKVISRSLREYGIRVSTAYNRKKALSALEEEVPGVVVADAEMRDLNGPEFVSLLRANPRTVDTAVVLLSVGAGDAVVFHAWSSGADAFLTRPLSVQEVINVVLALLG